MIKLCGVCHKQFLTSHRNRQSCSRVCESKRRSEALIGSRNPNWRGGRQPKTCVICERIFYPQHNDWAKAKFCSRVCMGTYRGKQYTGHSNPHWEGGKLEKTCLNCGQTFNRNASRIIKASFCSQHCKASYMMGKGNCNWLGGLSFEPYTVEFNRQLKELIRDRDNHQCRLCGIPEVELCESLCIHHIDYEKDNCLPSNLISLCRSCHAKVNFDRERWLERFTGQKAVKLDA